MKADLLTFSSNSIRLSFHYKPTSIFAGFILVSISTLFFHPAFFSSTFFHVNGLAFDKTHYESEHKRSKYKTTFPHSQKVLASSLPSLAMKPSPWCESEIDYSAANEYMNAHYYNNNNQPYFQLLDGESINTSPVTTSSGSDNQSGNSIESGKKIETIYDARQGIYHHSTQSLQVPSLSSCGFCLESFGSNVTNWNDMNQVSSIYLKEIREQLIPRLFQQHKDSNKSTYNNNNNNNQNDLPSDFVKNILFWHPMLREEKIAIDSEISNQKRKNNISHPLQKTTPRASIAPNVHIDTDIDAYPDLASVCNLIFKNQIHETFVGINDNNNDEQDILESLENGHRFMIVNFWRNISPYPLSRSPLAILSTHYKLNHDEDHKEDNAFFFPSSKPNMNQSWWYTFPNMDSNECLVFQQYDRRLSILQSKSKSSKSYQVSTHSSFDEPMMTTFDLWHCALSDDAFHIANEKNQNGEYNSMNDNRYRDNFDHEYRRSFDVRAFIVLHEKVPPEQDRFRISRKKSRRPNLNYEESGCFCDEQEQKRIKQKDVERDISKNLSA